MISCQEMTECRWVERATTPPQHWAATPVRREIQLFHWSSSYSAALSLVQRSRVLKYFHARKGPIIRGALSVGGNSKQKRTSSCTKNPQLGVFCLLLSGTLWHKNRWLPCTESSYYMRQWECWIYLWETVKQCGMLIISDISGHGQPCPDSSDWRPGTDHHFRHQSRLY